MKALFVIQILCCFSISSCQSQVTENQIDFIKVIEKEIANNKFDKNLFCDTVVFNGNISELKNNVAVKSEWDKVKAVFKNSDYVLHYCDKTLNIKNCVEIKNHNSIYLVQINNQGKINRVEKVKINLPPNAPTSN